MEEDRPKVFIEITEDGRLAVSWMGIKQGELEVLNLLGAGIEAVKRKLNDRSIVTPVRKAPFQLVEK